MDNKKNMNIYIFGAHSRARTLKEYLTHINPEIKIKAFLYDNDEENPSCIDDIPVFDISDDTSPLNRQLNTEYPVYLGIRGINHVAVTKHLKELGFKKIIPVTVDLDTDLRNRYLKLVFEEKGIPFRKLSDYYGNAGKDEHLNNIGIYVASSAYDAVIEKKHTYLPFEKVIQVGCELTDKRIDASAFDNDNENISGKNTQFCELTALYWIWRNAKESIVGLEHYRRFFVIPDNLETVMEQNKIDVILPVPLYVAPNLQENYLSRHTNKPWNDMLKVLSSLYSDDTLSSQEYFRQGLYSPCNMIIARKDIFDKFCNWLFPILFEIVELNGSLEDRYQNRYPGFLSERLMSYYFDKHKNEYNIVYADKTFLS